MLLYNQTMSTWPYTKGSDSRLNIIVEKFMDVRLANGAKIRLRKAKEEKSQEVGSRINNL